MESFSDVWISRKKKKLLINKKPSTASELGCLPDSAS